MLCVTHFKFLFALAYTWTEYFLIDSLWTLSIPFLCEHLLGKLEQKFLKFQTIAPFCFVVLLLFIFRVVLFQVK